MTNILREVKNSTVNGLFVSFEEGRSSERSLQWPCILSRKEKLMPKNSYQEIVHSINYKKNIVIENTNIVISYQDTKFLKIYAYRAV